MNYLVSIALCSYNGGKYIEEQIKSILNQSYTNLELIIVDDCSSDDTVEIVENLASADDRIKLFKNESNLGFVKNFEKAISLCNGDYIALCDQDDIWKINKIELFMISIEDNILIYSNALLVDSEGKETGQVLVPTKSNMVRGNNNKAFIFNNCVSGNTLMFCKQLIKYILPIPKGIEYHDSYIAFIASSIGKIEYVTEPLVYYRRYEEQVTHVKKSNSIFEKRENKKRKILNLQKDRLLFLNQISKLNFLDKETKRLINLLEEHYKEFGKGFINFYLLFYLIKNKNEFFFIFEEKKRLRIAIKTAFKLKMYKLFGYMV